MNIFGFPRARKLCLAFGYLHLGAVLFAVDATWFGGTSGNWSTDVSWSSLDAPLTSEFDVFIDGETLSSSSVNLNVSASINSLSIFSGDTLTISDNDLLTLNQESPGIALLNDGTLNISGLGNPTRLTLAGNAITIGGSGSIVLGNRTSNYLRGSGVITHGPDHTIRGAGRLLENLGGMVNQGTIEASSTVGMVIDPSDDGFVNQGILSATGSGGLSLFAGTYTNTGEVISVGTGSTLRLYTETVLDGGELQTAGTGQVTLSGSPTLSNGVRINGQFNIPDNRFVQVDGGLVNDGSIAFSSLGNLSQLIFAGGIDQTISGAGTISLNNRTTNRVRADDATLTLGPGQTLSGAGNLMVDLGGMVNQGTIIANQTNALTIDPNVLGFLNEGTLQATGSGGLILNPGVFINTGETIEIGNGSKVTVMSGTEIHGGTILATSGGSGTLSFASSPTFDDIVLEAPMPIPDNRSATLKTDFVNNNRVSLSSAGNVTRLIFDYEDPVLKGAGDVVMGNRTTNQIRADGTVLTLDAGHTISGAGNLMVNLGGMVNRGTIIANQTNALTIDPNESGFLNEGTLQATGSGGIILNPGIFTNTGETIEIGNGSKVTVMSGTEIHGGTILATPGGSGTLSFASSPTFDDIVLEAPMPIPDNRSATLKTDFVNNNRISLSSLGNATQLIFDYEDPVLTGTGDVVMSNRTTNQIRADETVLVLDAGHTISGAGNLMVNLGGMVNRGTIIANQTNALTIDPNESGFLNEGTLQASGSGGLSFSPGVYTNTGRTIEIASGSRLRVFSGTEIVEGIIAGAGTGTLSLGGSPTFTRLVANAPIPVPNNTSLFVKDEITNNDTISLNSLGNVTQLSFSGEDPFLRGTGSVSMSSRVQNQIRADGETLTVVAEQTIQGAGNMMVNLGGMLLEGTLIASQTSALVIDPDERGFTNAGTMRATGSGGLTFAGGTFENSDNTIEIGDGSKLSLSSNTRLVGGSIDATNEGNGFISLLGVPTISGVTLNLPMTVPNNSSVNLEDVTTNNGQISLNSLGNTTRLTFVGADPVLEGTGTVAMSNRVQNQIRSDGEVLTIGPEQTILGSGNLLVNLGGMVNQGTIIGSGSASLTIDPDTLGFSNEGILLATGTGGVTLSAGTHRNEASGVFGGSSTINLSAASFTNAGSIAPGTSPGGLNIVGDLPFEETASLDIEIAGITAGSEYDQLTVAGQVDLNGNLNITLLDDYLPPSEATFSILSAAGGINGSFDNVIEGSVEFLEGTFDVTNDGNTLTLSNFASAVDPTKSVADVILTDLDQIFDGAPRPVTVATVPSGLSVNVTYDGSPTVPTTVGSYEVFAEIDDASFLGRATGRLNVVATQTLDFPALTPGLSVLLSATASSGLPVVFSVTPSRVAVIEGTTLIARRGGEVVVTAAQDGDSQFLPVSESQTLRLPPVIASFTASGAPIENGRVFQTATPVLGLSVFDDIGIDQVAFSIRSAGVGTFTVFDTDTDSSGGFTAALPVEAQGDGDFEIKATATAVDGVSVELVRTVTFLFRPVITIALDELAYLEGDEITGTVSLNGIRGSETVVSFALSPQAIAGAPASVSIPAGILSVPFTVNLFQDDNIEPDEAFTIQAQTNTTQSNAITVPVVDDDAPSLELVLDSDTISESAGDDALFGTVTRSPASTLSLTVQLRSSDTSAATVPTSVVIPAGLTFVEFPLDAVDDALIDGEQSTTISAELVIEGQGTVASASPVELVVTDDEGPLLELSGPPAGFLAEGESGQLIITRLTLDASEALEVSLNAEAPLFTFPTTASFGPDETEIVVPITATTESGDQGERSTSIEASAAGFTPASTVLALTDRGLADLRVVEGSAPATVTSDTFFSFDFTLANRGLEPTQFPFSIRVFLSRDAVLDAGDEQIKEIFNSGQIGIGELVRGETVRSPQETGEFHLILVVDSRNTVDELFEDNNEFRFPETIFVQPAYSATVATDTETAAATLPVIFTGSASSGSAPAVSSLVNIHITSNGVTRIISALTDASGDFEISWIPLIGESGVFEVGAAHPGEATAPIQDQFTLLNLAAEGFPAEGTRIEEGTTATIEGSVLNPNSIALTELEGELVGLPPEFTVAPLTLPELFAPGASAAISLEVTVPDDFTGSFEAALLLNTAEGILLEVPLFIDTFAQQAVLRAAPGRVSAAVLREGQRSIPIQIVNEGGAATGSLLVSLPSLPWLKLNTPSEIDSLEPGESTTLNLLLMPDASVALTEYSGNFVIGGNTTRAISIPFDFRVVTDERGDLAIDVVDEFFYFSEERPRPKVADAVVSIADAISGDLIAEQTTDVSGELLFSNLRAGFYTVRVNGPRHAAESFNVFVEPGEVSSRQAFITRQSVIYNFTVREIAIEDRYQITIESTFETNVPKPVVTVEPATLELSDLVALGQSKVINYTITNHGLIAADSGGIDFDDHPFFEITPLVENLGEIGAKSNMTVPVTVRRIGEFDDSGQPRYLADVTGDTFARASLVKSLEEDTASKSRLTGRSSSSAIPCTVGGYIHYSYICGPTDVDKSIRIPGSGISCPSGGGGGGGAGGGFFGGSGGAVGGAPGGGGSRPDVVVNFSTPATQSECPCLPFGDLCVSGGAQVSLDGIASQLASAVSGVLPPWAKVEDVKIDLSANGELCVCCKADGTLGLEGEGSASASVSGSIIIGYSGGFELSEGNGIVDGEISLSALAGVKTDLSGSVTVTANKPCGGDLSACVTGSISANLFAGLQGSGGASLTLLSDSGVEQKVSGKAEGTIGTNGNAQATVKGCLDGTLTFEACASVQVLANASVTIESPAGKEMIGVNGDGPKLEIGTCSGGGGDGPAMARLVGRNAKGELEILASDIIEPEPYIIEVPGAQFIIPEQEIIEDIFDEDFDFGGGVCAQVKLRVSQDLVTTRSAFLAALELANNDETPLVDVSVAVEVRDSDGNDASEHFNIRVTRTTGVDISGGPGVVAAGGAGSVEWTLIPRDSAAPENDTIYTIGGLIGYQQEGSVVSIPVETVDVTVQPDAALFVSYFHQRDVYADDPFTDIIEPSIPYNLAVVVENRGFGTARNLSITSGQPEIVDNEKGLLIDFQIIGTQVAGENITPTLNANFGDVDPGEREIATWLITSSLQGLFIDYAATFEHLTGLGDPRLSLIKELEIHEMIRAVEAQGALDDGLPDFLTNDVADPGDLPDTIHLSGGDVMPVAVFESATHPVVNSGNLTIQLDTDLGTGWNYLRIPEPGKGIFELQRVTRSDGRELPMDINVWVTNRSFPGLGRPAIREDLLHLVDDESTGSYLLEYELVEADEEAPTSSVAALPATSPESFIVNWSSDDTEARYDIFISENGGSFTLWQECVAQTSALFTGEAGVTYGFYSEAMDSAGNREDKAESTEAVTLVAEGLNQAPIFSTPSNFVVMEGQSLSTFLRATDPDGQGAPVLFSLVSADHPSIVLNEVNGALSFASSETDGGQTFNLSVAATDSGLPQMQITQAITIEVLENNSPPTVTNPGAQMIEAGDTLSLEIGAQDADQPSQMLSFDLIEGPEGMTIDPTTGALEWQTSLADAGRLYPVTVSVSDDGLPPETETVDFIVNVRGDPIPVLVVRDSSSNELLAGSSIDVGGQGDSVSITLENTGLATLNVSSIELVGGLVDSFELDTDSTQFSLEPGASTSFEISLISGGGFIFANLTIASDVPDFALSLEGLINRPPTFIIYRAATDFETPVDLPVAKILARASDPDGQAVRIESVDDTSSEGGTVQLIGAVVRYSPADGFFGEDDFNVLLADALDATTPGPVIVEVRPPDTHGDAGANRPLIRVLEDDSIEITLFGIPGTTYTIQRSKLLDGDWVNVGTIQIQGNGTGVFRDESPPEDSAFYRLNF